MKFKNGKNFCPVVPSDSSITKRLTTRTHALEPGTSRVAQKSYAYTSDTLTSLFCTS